MSAAADAADVVVDCRGAHCPIPVIELAKAARRCEPGAVIEILSDDAGAKVDIPVWCRMKGHELLAREDRDRGWSFRVRVSSP